MAMSKISGLKKKRQLNNNTFQLKDKGFSLIEALVAIAILAVFALPIISAFMSSAKINLRARQEENANAVSQKIMESMKSKSIEQAMKDYDSLYLTQLSSVSNLNRYVFNLGKYDADCKKYDESNGSTGDEFYVRVTLDPDEFADRVDGGSDVGNTNNNINSYNMPSFTDIQSDTNYAVMRQIYEYDDDAQKRLGVSKGMIYRKVDVNIDVSNKDALGGEMVVDGFSMYTQTVSLRITYADTSNPLNSVSYDVYVGTNVVKGNLTEAKYKDIYLFYTPYDKYRNDPADSHKGMSNDEVRININCNTTSGKYNSEHPYDDLTAVMENKKINVYLVQQNTVNVYDNTTKVELKKSNITFYENGISQPITTKTMGVGSNGNINILTNVAGLMTTTATGSVSNSLTQNTGEDSEIKYLYNMKVEVWINEEPSADNEPAWTVMSTKENAHE